MSTPFTKLVSVGGHLPGPPVGNDHFASYLDTSDEWIQTRTGIQTRHFAAKGTSAVELAVPAVNEALTKSGLAKSAIDAIIVATTTPDAIMPATACLLQQELGIASALAFDIQAACSGFVYGVSVANGLIQTKAATNVLLVASEIYSRIIDMQDRSTCILFGDGAAATVLSAADKPGVLAVDLHAEGKHAEILSAPAHIAGHKISGDPTFKMDGGEVFKLAVTAMAESCTTVCQQAELELAQIDFLVAHQANLRIINAVAKRLGIAEEKVVRTVIQHANTSAASIPLALATVWEQVQPGDKLLLTAAGAGLTWGSVVLQA